jgi:hypothetical protein
MDEELVVNLLIKYGELERANNPKLVQDMVKAAQSTTGCLDVESFVNAISSDLTDWMVGSEDALSTLFEDVFGPVEPAKVTQLQPEAPWESCYVDVEAARSQSSVVMDASRSQINGNVGISTRTEANLCSRACSSMFCFLTLGWCFGYCATHDGTVFAVEPCNIDAVIDTHSSNVAAIIMWFFAIAT